MPISSRPTGVFCPGFVTQDGFNSYGKLKQFLFEENTGRTDVLFHGSIVSCSEPNQWQYSDLDTESYHYTGGLIDGICKALVVGTPSWAGRSIYATPVYSGWQTHIVPGLDYFNASTWNNPNTSGVGSFLSGCSTFYDNILYYNNTTQGRKSSANFSYFSTSDEPARFNIPTWDPDSEEIVSLTTPSQLFAKSLVKFVPLGQRTPNGELLNTLAPLITMHSVVWSNVEESVNPNKIISYSFAFTPNQPTRFWNQNLKWLINKTQPFYLGVAFMDATTNIITEVFSAATTHNYIIPDTGITVGATINSGTLNANYGIATQNNGVWTGAAGQVLAQFWGEPPNSTSLKNYAASIENNKKIIYRIITMEQLITKFSLNILANKEAIVNEATYNSCDGFYVDANNIIMKKTFPTPNYSAQDATSITQLNQVYLKKYGIATVDSPFVASGQEGYPYAIIYGVRPTLQNENNPIFNFYGAFRAGGTPVLVTGNKMLGFPLTLNTLGSRNIFALSQADTVPLTTNSPTIYKNKGIIIKPHLGKVFNTYAVDGSGFTPSSRLLTLTERNDKLSIYKSAQFTHVVTCFNINKYSGESNVASGNIALTCHTTNSAGTETLLDSQNFTLSQTTNTNTNSVRGITEHVLTKTYNLSSVNSSHNLRSIKLGFLGRDTAHITKGNIGIFAHYGIDTANQHGISFTILNRNAGGRTGDDGYKFGNSNQTLQAQYQIYFKESYRRQTALNASPAAKKKVVIFYEIGLWELADIGLSYNGVGAWGYLPATTSVNYNSKISFPSINNIGLILQAAINAGFSRDEVVIVYFTPGHLSNTALPGFGSINGYNFGNPVDVENYLQSPNQRSSFARASELFNNTFLSRCGYYNECTDNLVPLASPAANLHNSCYINLGVVPAINSKVSNIGTSGAIYCYASDTEESSVKYNNYAPEAALGIGHTLVEYINQTQATVNFVPAWLTPFSSMLNYTTDPVSGAAFAFTSPTSEGSLINTYLLEFYDLVKQHNTQATRTLCYFKTKTLQ